MTERTAPEAIAAPFGYLQAAKAAGTMGLLGASSDASEGVMVKSATATQPEVTPKLRAGLREHRRDVERLRAEIGDAQSALSAFVRDVFDPSAFDPEPVRSNGQAAEDDDDDLVGW